MKLDIKIQTPPKRQRYKEKIHSSFVAKAIADNYNKLKIELCNNSELMFSSMNCDDIFHETVLYVIQDKVAFDMKEQEIIKHFMYRYNMIKFQIIQDSKLINYTNADNLQAKEETE